MNAITKNNALIAVALIICTLPPLVSGSVFHAIRVSFNTVGLQTPIENYLGDTVFFLVATAFFITPWVVAIAFRLKGISNWNAVVPLLALIICWLLRQRERPLDFEHIVSWIAYIGFSYAVIGYVGSGHQERHWLKLVWLPSMFFLILLLGADWWFNVFFE